MKFVNSLVEWIIIVFGSYCLLAFGLQMTTNAAHIVSLGNGLLAAFCISLGLFSKISARRFDRLLINPQKIEEPGLIGNSPAPTALFAIRLLRALVYLKCLLFLSNFQSNRIGAGLRKGLGYFEFRKHAKRIDWILAILSMASLIAGITTLALWGLTENPSFSYAHGDSYYIAAWWHQTLISF